ncbi:MAG: tandem-95 repeat protein, partial [Caldilineae bacterium]
PGFLGLFPAPTPIAVCSLTNIPPVANQDAATTEVDIPITLDVTINDFDPDGWLVDSSVALPGAGGTLILPGAEPANGSLANNGDGTFTYTPNAGFTGSDSFQYTIADNDGAVSAPATVNITVNPAGFNLPPTATDDAAVTGQDTAVTINLIANDADPDGSLDSTSVAIVDAPLSGSVLSNGNGTATYTPNPGFSGEDSFTYTVNDNDGATSNVATVRITVNAVDTVGVDRAEFRAGRLEWRVQGTAGPGSTVTIYVGQTAGGPVLGTALTDAFGVWRLRIRNASIGPDATNTISVESDGGGLLEGAPVTVK